MIEVRPFESLGGADHGWLDAAKAFERTDFDHLSSPGRRRKAAALTPM